MNITEELIQDYEDAFDELHGYVPEVIRKGGWVYINDSPTAHRSSALPEMIDRLKEMKKEKDKPIPDDEPDDIRALISAIRQDGRHIFRSTDVRQMRKAGNRIAKTAKRILNILDSEHGW